MCILPSHCSWVFVNWIRTNVDLNWLASCHISRVEWKNSHPDGHRYHPESSRSWEKQNVHAVWSVYLRHAVWSRPKLKQSSSNKPLALSAITLTVGRDPRLSPISGACLCLWKGEHGQPAAPHEGNGKPNVNDFVVWGGHSALNNPSFALTCMQSHREARGGNSYIPNRLKGQICFINSYIKWISTSRLFLPIYSLSLSPVGHSPCCSLLSWDIWERWEMIEVDFRGQKRFSLFVLRLMNHTWLIWIIPSCTIR